MPHSEINELTQVEKLLDACKLDEARKLLDDLIQLEGLDYQQKGYYQVLKAKILFYQGKHEEATKFGERIIEEGQKLNDNLQIVDGLTFAAMGLMEIRKWDDAFEYIEKADALLKNISHISHRDLMERKSRIYVSKGAIYSMRGNFEIAQKKIEKTISLQKELGITPAIVSAHISMATIMRTIRSRFDLALEYIKKALMLAEEMEFNHFWIAMCHLHFGIIYGEIGEIDLCLKHEMMSLALFKEINNKQMVAGMLNNIGASHSRKENYDLAVKYLEESLILSDNAANCFTNLIHIELEKGNIERAQHYFQKLENLSNQKKDRIITTTCQFTKALILKKSPRIRDRAKAEEIYKQIIDDGFSLFLGLTIPALIQLCDLLLMELSITNNIEVIDEVNDYITQLLDKAEKSHSYWVLCETYTLQAKLALLTLDLKEAQRLLAQAQKIAEKYKIIKLARKISNEHDELLKQLAIWEKMDKTDVSLPERLKLARINVQMENMTKRRAIDVPELSDEEPVHLLIVSEGGTPFFSQSFIEDKSFEDDIFGSFFTAINSFINEKFSEGLDRASFGDYTLLMNSASPFLMCYVYKGQSYSAQQRLRYFIEKIQSDNEVWGAFEKYFQTNQEIQLKDIPSLKPLIKEIFIDKTILLTKKTLIIKNI